MLDSVIDARSADLGNGLMVRRVLPFAKRRMVGPFIFFDHAGPVTLAPEAARKADVRPHPHIGLATVSYLFNGAVTHRDSLGMEQVIRPGDVSWMTAGRGIAHSESVYIVSGSLEFGAIACQRGRMLVFAPGSRPSLRALEASTVMLLGGEPLGERHIWWNFVSSRKERIEQAKADWQAGRIALPPNDRSEFIPLP